MFLYSSKGFGGMVQNISLIVNNMNKETFNIILVSLTNYSDEESAVKLNKEVGVNFHRINEKDRLDFSSLRKISILIKQHNIDILSCHGYKADFYGYILRTLFKCHVKLLTIAHGWVTPGLKLQIYYFLDKLVLRFFDKIILVSESQRRELSGFIVPAKKIVIINNAINSESYKKVLEDYDFRKKFDLKSDDKIIGFVGRLSREKDVGTTLYAIKEVINYQKNIKFLVVGEGPERQSLEKIAKYLGISKNIVFAGYQKDVKKIYNILDLYVSAALKEGFPNSILEAQGMGVPCIATDISGNNEIIENGLNGFLFRPKDYKTLSQRIATLLENRNLAIRFVAEGQRIIKERFSLEERIRRLENLYKEALT